MPISDKQYGLLLHAQRIADEIAARTSNQRQGEFDDAYNPHAASVISQNQAMDSYDSRRDLRSDWLENTVAPIVSGVYNARGVGQYIADTPTEVYYAARPQETPLVFPAGNIDNNYFPVEMIDGFGDEIPEGYMGIELGEVFTDYLPAGGQSFPDPNVPDPGLDAIPANADEFAYNMADEGISEQARWGHVNKAGRNLLRSRRTTDLTPENMAGLKAARYAVDNLSDLSTAYDAALGDQRQSHVDDTAAYQAQQDAYNAARLAWETDIGRQDQHDAILSGGFSDAHDLYDQYKNQAIGNAALQGVPEGSARLTAAGYQAAGDMDDLSQGIESQLQSAGFNPNLNYGQPGYNQNDVGATRPTAGYGPRSSAYGSSVADLQQPTESDTQEYTKKLMRRERLAQRLGQLQVGQRRSTA